VANVMSDMIDYRSRRGLESCEREIGLEANRAGQRSASYMRKSCGTPSLRQRVGTGRRAHLFLLRFTGGAAPLSPAVTSKFAELSLPPTATSASCCFSLAARSTSRQICSRQPKPTRGRGPRSLTSHFAGALTRSLLKRSPPF